jgi:DNA polymerase I
MTTQLPQAGSEDTLYIVDLSGYVFRAYHAVSTNLTSPTGEPTHAVFGTVNMLQRMIKERRPAMIAVAMDSEGPTFRHELDPRYKANRPEPPPDLSQQMDRCRQVVEAYGLPVFQQNGIEADDWIATLVKASASSGHKVIILSADKDLMQLVDDRVCMWDTMRNRVYGSDEVVEKFGVVPAKLRDLLALTGDTSDNIPGVPSVGPKTAAQLLNEYETLQGIYDNLSKITRKKLKEALETNKKDAFLSQVLVTLKDDLEITYSAESLVPKEQNKDLLRQLFTELGFHRLRASVDEKPATAPPPSLHSQQCKTILSEKALDEFITNAENAPLLAVDTETSNRDPMLAKLIGISLSYRSDEAVYVPIGHEGQDAGQQLPLDVVRPKLQALFAKKERWLVGHNFKYDELILRRHGFTMSEINFDTMIASYLLDPGNSHGLKDLASRELNVTMTTYDQVTKKQRGKQLAFAQVPIVDATEYAAADALMTLQLTEKLTPRLETEGMLDLLRNVELPLSHTLVDLELNGILLNVNELHLIGERLDSKLKLLEKQAYELAGKEFNLSAPRQLETILFDELKLKVIKRTKTARSTDAEVLEALASEHALPSVIFEHRQLAKLKSTYIDTLPELVHPDTKRIHGRFNQTVAATGRLSSSDPNLQNIPIRSEEGREIRRAFHAPEGFELVSADYSQIELRVLAHLSKDPVLTEAFRKGEDIHSRTAKEIFEVTDDQLNAEMRRTAKAINFGVIYGMGDSALAKRLGIEKEEATKFIKRYFKRYAGVQTYMNKILEEARSVGSVSTILGRRRFLPDLSSANRSVRLGAERVAQNTPIQGSAADILKLAMIKLREPVVPEAKMVLTVHDELVFEIPTSALEQASELIRASMENVMALDVPLVVDVGHGKTWAEAH